MSIKTYDQLFDAEDKEANHDGSDMLPPQTGVRR